MDKPNKNFAERLLDFTTRLQTHKPPRSVDGILYGDMHNRIFAVLIDLILLLPVLIIIPTLLLPPAMSMQRTIILNSYQYLVIGIYNIIFIYKCGATPGKIFVGLKVVDVTTHAELSLSQTIIRFLAYITFPLGMIFGSFKRNKRSWHDLIADTVVIYSPNRWYKRHYDVLKAKLRKFLNMPDK